MPVNIFKRPERGYKLFGRVSDPFPDSFLRFSNRSSYQFKSFSGAVSFCRHAALSLCLGSCEGVLRFMGQEVTGRHCNAECKLSNGWSRSDRETSLPLSAGK